MNLFSLIQKGYKKKLPGFSLIELSIVMIIVGILTAGIFKGKDLIEKARLDSTLAEFGQIKILLIQYREQFSQWPGNDSRAGHYFQNVRSGNGRGAIQQDRESDQVWVHLEKAGFVTSPQVPTGKIGGYFSVWSNPTPDYPGNWIILSAEPKTLQGLLTPKQALYIKSKLDESEPTKGDLVVINGEGTQDCLTGNTYNTDVSTPACVVMMKL